MKKLFITLLASTLLLTSCTTSEQFFGTATGASLGGMFGSAIGGITGGRRGHNAGALAGMVIGGVIGAAATAPDKDKSRTSDYYNGYSYNDYRDYSHSPYRSIEIDDIRMVDYNNNDAIDAGEHAKLSFTIRNIGDEYVYDIAPVITVSGTKEIYLSPTAIVSELAPGRAVRYTAEVVATRKLKNGIANFTISFSDGDVLYTLRSFDLRTYRR